MQSRFAKPWTLFSRRVKMKCDTCGYGKEVPPPEIRRKDGNTYVMADTCWQTPLRCVTMLAQRCTDFYNQHKRIVKTTTPPEFKDIIPECDCRSSLDLLCAGASKTVEIIVPGEDEIAEDIARQVYSAFTATCCHELDFHKWDRKES
jgi:hypothetical protein